MEVHRDFCESLPSHVSVKICVSMELFFLKFCLEQISVGCKLTPSSGPASSVSIHRPIKKAGHSSPIVHEVCTCLVRALYRFSLVVYPVFAGCLLNNLSHIEANQKLNLCCRFTLSITMRCNQFSFIVCTLVIVFCPQFISSTWW